MVDSDSEHSIQKKTDILQAVLSVTKQSLYHIRAWHHIIRVLSHGVSSYVFVPNFISSLPPVLIYRVEKKFRTPSLTHRAYLTSREPKLLNLSRQFFFQNLRTPRAAENADIVQSEVGKVIK